MKFLLLLILPLCLIYCPVCHATDYYVTPTNSSNPDCPVGEPCFTFDHYAQEFSNSSYYDGKHNITLIFLQGTHNLTQNFVVRHSNSLVLRGISDIPSVAVFLNADISSLGAVTKVMFKSLKFNDNGYTFHSVGIDQPAGIVEIILEQVIFDGTFLVVTGNGISGNMQIVDSVFICSSIDIEVAYKGNFNISILSSSFYSGPSVSPMNIQSGRTRFALQVYNTRQDTFKTSLLILQTLYVSHIKLLILLHFVIYV